MALNSVCFVIKEFDPARGGGEKFTYHLLKELTHHLPAFKVVCMSVRLDLLSTFDVTVLKISKNPLIPKSKRFNAAFKKWLQLNPCSCVVALTQVESANIYRAGGGLWKIWQTIQKQESYFRYLKSFLSLNRYVQMSLEKRILASQELKYIVVNSMLVKNQMISMYPQLNEKIILIENGISIASENTEESSVAEDNFQCETGKTHLVFVSNNFERKGLLLILQALQGLPGCVLHVLGSGHIQKFSHIAQKLGVAKQVIFKGHVKHVSRYVSKCDIFILPTQYDPCSNATIEAIYMGLPVITTHLNGASMYVKEESGVLIGADCNADTLKQAILHISQPDTLMHMKSNAKMNVAHLNYKNTAKQFEDLIHKH